MTMQAIPRRLNVGCGWDRRDGYLNVDLQEFHEPDLVGDARDLRELPSGHFEEILAIDVLEHLPRTDCAVALAEWWRLLVDGGRLMLQVPDVVAVARLLCERRDVSDQRTLVQNLFGTQAYTGDWHQNGFTELLLRAELHEAGFDVLALTHRDEWLFDVTAAKRSTPAPFAPGDLPFMQLWPIGTGPHARDDQPTERRLEELIGLAADHAHAGELAATVGRFRTLKRFVLRLARIHTHHQRAYNEALLELAREFVRRQNL
jgi:hypothetical protein